MNQVLRFVITAVVLVLWTLGPAFSQSLFSPTQDPIAGSRVFGTKGCAHCHAVNGVGGQVGPDLGRNQRPRSFFDLAATLWNHLPLMAKKMRELKLAQPDLTPRETGDLISFLFTLNYFDPQGNPEAGRRHFLEKKCVICHQVGRTGGVIGPSLDFLKEYSSPIYVATAMWNHGPSMVRAMESKGLKRPVFKNSELLDLISYFKSVSRRGEEALYVLPGRPDEGRRLFREKRCIECHSVNGKGGQIGGGLAERRLQLSLTQFAVAMWNKAPAMMKAMKEREIEVIRLQAEEMSDIVAYLYSVRYFAESGDPQKGRKLVTDKGCLKCHSLEGKGGKVAVDFAQMKGLDSPATVISALWKNSFLMEPLVKRQKIVWPQFTSEEMSDLVAFLQTVGRSR